MVLLIEQTQVIVIVINYFIKLQLPITVRRTIFVSVILRIFDVGAVWGQSRLGWE